MSILNGPDGEQDLFSSSSQTDDEQDPTTNGHNEADTMVPAPFMQMTIDEDDAALHEGAGKEAIHHEDALPPIDAAQFEYVFTRFQTPIINYLYRLTGNREQALDLAQDVFVKAYRALIGGTVIHPDAISSWIYRIASNTATDALRRRRLISWLPLSLFNEDRGIGAGMSANDGDDSSAAGSALAAMSYDGGRFETRIAERETVQTVLARIPEKYSVCLLLYEYEGFSCAEISEMLTITPSAVKMRLMRAREKFIALYQQEVAGSGS